MRNKMFLIKTNRPKLNIFKLLIIFLFLFIFISVPVKAKEKPCTVLLGDFMVTLVNLEREGDIANLEFSVTKVADSNSGCQSLVVYLIDDHENEYKGSLRIDLGGASDFMLNNLPKSFAYVDMVSISIPEIAPIDKIRIGNTKEQAFKEVKTVTPQFMKELADFAITKGQSVTVGKWLSFILKDIIPASHHWDLLIKIENKEYNPLNGSVRVAVQLNDGTISWSGSESEDIPGLSESLLKIPLPISSWLKGGPPQPRALLLVYSANIPETKKVLKMFSMNLDELPPLVGQGINEDLFLEAYEHNGGCKIMGTPLDIPRWFAGGDKPKDKNDVLIQEFPSVSEFGKSAIIWDKQHSKDKAYFIYGDIYKAYYDKGGPYYKGVHWKRNLGAPINNQLKDIEGNPLQNFEGGYIGKLAKGEENLVPVQFPFGKILSTYNGNINIFDNERGICKVLINANYSLNPAWSPNGKEIAFNMSFQKHYTLSIANENGKILRNLEEGFGPAWSPDGHFLVFLKDLEHRAIYIMDKWGKNKRKLNLNVGNMISKVSWSPTGDEILYFTWGKHLNLYKCQYLISGKIYKVLIDGNNNELLTEGVCPKWSPNGKKIAFLGDNRKSIYIMNPDGSSIQRLKTFSEYIGCFDWSPDSKGFVISINSEIYILRPGDFDLIKLPLKSRAFMSIYDNISWYGDLN